MTTPRPAQAAGAGARGGAGDAPPSPDPAPGDTQALVDFVANRDVPCPRCGHNLRRLTCATCPECGIGLALRVGATEPYRLTWAVMFGVHAMMAGVGALFILLTLAVGDPNPRGMPGYLGYYGPIASVPLPVASLLLRRRFCMLHARWQWAAVAGSLAWLIAIAVGVVDMV